MTQRARASAGRAHCRSSSTNSDRPVSAGEMLADGHEQRTPLGLRRPRRLAASEQRLAERLHERLVRHRELLVAAAVEHGRRPGRTRAKPAARRVLPIPASPATKTHAHAARHDLRPALAQALQLGLAADERRVRGELQRRAEARQLGLEPGAASCRRLLQDRPLQLAEALPGLEPELVEERLARRRKASSASAWRSGAIEGDHQLGAQSARGTAARRSALRARRSLRRAGRARACASVRSSSALSRRSSRRSMCGRANGSCARSASGGPRHSDERLLHRAADVGRVRRGGDQPLESVRVDAIRVRDQRVPVRACAG